MGSIQTSTKTIVVKLNNKLKLDDLVANIAPLRQTNDEIWKEHLNAKCNVLRSQIRNLADNINDVELLTLVRDFTQHVGINEDEELSEEDRRNEYELNAHESNMSNPEC